MPQLSETQKHLLKIYKEFRRFCEENNLRFYAVAGTALGAIRHQGFIPWDDDIDLGMPIKDFLRFKKILQKKSLPHGLGFRESYWMGGKVYDTDTTIIDTRFLSNTDNYHGVYIDIFPLVGLPDSQPEQERFIEDIKLFEKSAQLFECYPEISSFSEKQILNWKKYLQKAYDFESSKKVAALCYFVYDGDGLRSPINIPFEDTTIPISSNYDWDLKNHFGDYMTIPKKSEQKTHDEYHILDLNNSFKKYIKEYSKLPSWLHQIINKKQINEGKLTQYCNSLSYELSKKDEEIKNLNDKINNIIKSKDYKIGNKVLKPARFVIRKIKEGRKK